MIDLTEMENQLDNALLSETNESITNWYNNKHKLSVEQIASEILNLNAFNISDESKQHKATEKIYALLHQIGTEIVKKETNKSYTSIARVNLIFDTYGIDLITIDNE